MSVGRALYRSLLHRVGRGRLRELLDEVPFRIPATALPLCGEEAFVRAGQPIPTLRYDPHGPPVSLGPPPVATRADLLRLVQVSFKTEVRDGEDAERMEGAFEGLRRLTALQSQLEGLVQTREKRDGDREQVRYSIGEVFRHKNFGYRGVVVGWDGHCNRPKEWLTGNGMSAARGQQPFYHIIPDQADCVRLFGSTRESKYVAQDNLEPIDDVEERAIDHEHLMAFFSRYSPATGAFVPCEELAYIYPDEYPVVEEEEDTASFIVAAQRGDLVQLQEKLDKGVDVDAMDQWGNGALHWAAHHGHHQCAATLLEYGADPDLVHGNFGITPLHCAKSVSVLNLLLGHGANPYAIDQEGYSVSDWAAAAKRDEVVVVLTALQDSATGRADPRRPPANLVEFCSTLVEPVEKYAHTAQARGKYYGRFGSALIHIMVFHSSAWDQSSGADSAYEDVLTAMTEAHSEYRPATFLNVLVDMADPSNADIVKQFGMSNAKIPTIRALSFERSDSTSTDSTRRGVATLCGQSIPDFDFDFGEPTSYVRFATQLEEIALAPTVTVRPDVNMDGQGRELTRLGGSGWTEDVSSSKVRIAEVPSPESLEEGTAVVATHPSYGPHRWWDATVVARDADSRDGEDEGVFLEFDDGDQAYRKLDQLRLALPLPEEIGDKQGDREPQGSGEATAATVPTALADGVEVLVQGRQYTHNGAGPYYEWTRGEVVAPAVSAQGVEKDASGESME